MSLRGSLEGKRVTFEVYVKGLKAWRYGRGSSTGMGRCDGIGFSMAGSKDRAFRPNENGRNDPIELKMLFAFGSGAEDGSGAVERSSNAKSSSAFDGFDG